MKRFSIFLSYFLICMSCHVFSSTIIAVEGIPGAGKTTTLVRLAERLEGVGIILPEVNPEPHSDWQNLSNEELPEAYHNYWVERIKLLKHDFYKEQTFILDRSYFSNLACVYALDKFIGTDLYSYRKSIMQQELHLNSDFDLVIVLNIELESLLKRKSQSLEANPWPWLERDPWPWNEPEFLGYLRDFYLLELPGLIGVGVQMLTVDGLSKEDVFENVLDLILSVSPLKSKSSKVCDRCNQVLLDFAHQHYLGSPLSRPVIVFGNPTVYFEKHAIQMNSSGEVVFLNNDRIRMHTAENTTPLAH